MGSADPVNVVGGQETSGIDAVVQPTGSCADTDGDRLTDCAERDHYETDPNDADTDGDGFSDGFEVNGGTCAGIRFEGGSDPTDPTSTPAAPSFWRLPGSLPGKNRPPICQ